MSDHKDNKTQIITKELPHTFSNSELREIADSLVAKLGEISVREVAKKNKAAELKAAIDKLKEEADELASKHRKGKEDRDVECEVTFNYDRKIVITVRTDTGEIIEERAMTAAELQLDFDSSLPSTTSEETTEEDASPTADDGDEDPPVEEEPAIDDIEEEENDDSSDEEGYEQPRELFQ